MLPLLKGGARAKNDVYILENFVFENIPKNWIMQCELKFVNEDTSWTEVLAFLQTCEKYFKKDPSEKLQELRSKIRERKDRQEKYVGKR